MKKRVHSVKFLHNDEDGLCLSLDGVLIRNLDSVSMGEHGTDSGITSISLSFIAIIERDED